MIDGLSPAGDWEQTPADLQGSFNAFERRDRK
jgi:hypothetical protein